MRLTVLIVATSLPLAACTAVDNPPTSDPTKALDAQHFACAVEPILARDCSYNACHGNAAFPFRVYSPGKLRQGSPATLDDKIKPLTAAEHAANFASASGFSFEGVAPDDNLLLRKNLPAEDGGYEHIGGSAFTGTSDPAYKAIHDWLAGAKGCP